MRLRFAVVVWLAVSCRASDPPPTGSTSEPIVGGALDTGHQYVVGVGDSSGPFCTGTLISKRTVITAGHCYSSGSPTGGITRVFFGPDLTGTPAGVNVAAATLMPGFDFSTLHNDLTMVKLAADAPVQPAMLLRATMDNSSVYVGPKWTFTGYGVTNGMTGAGFGLRRSVTFPVANVGPATVGGTPGTIDSTQFYYDTPMKNTCNGDSGGPAFHIHGGVERVAGSTSFGDGPCTFDGVDERTDAPNITAFIQSEIDLFEGTSSCRNDGVCDDTCNTGPQLVDPDCAPLHCGADGICALACVAPVDPDCTGISHCGADGECDPSCASDVDCTNDCLLDGNCIHTGCATPDPDCTAIDAGPGMTPDATVVMPPDAAPPPPPDAMPPPPDASVHMSDGGASGDAGGKGGGDGCGCRVGGGSPGGGSGFALLGLLAAAAIARTTARRRRHRDAK